jgi:Smg protein
MPTGEALQSLVRELRRRFPSDADVREVEIWLASLGYDARQIAQVREALAAEVASGGEADQGEAGGGLGPEAGSGPPEWPPIRVAAPYERARFAPEAWGHLLQLRAAGLDGVEFEQLVDRALLQVEGRIAVEDLRALLEAGGGGGDEPQAPGAGTVH